MNLFRTFAVVSSLTFACWATDVSAQEQPLAFVNARILTAAEQILDPGTLIVENGKIRAVGLTGKTPVPTNCKVIDLTGKTVIPGLVDSHSHLGVYSKPGVKANSDGNEMTGPMQGIVRAIDSLNPFDPGIRMANAGKRLMDRTIGCGETVEFGYGSTRIFRRHRWTFGRDRLPA
jgi:imidazolonepropionase-like amidohydrolase